MRSHKFDWQNPGPFAVCLLAFALRMFNLNTRPVWYDEAFAALFAEQGFGAMLRGTLTPVGGAAADVHPILYYTLLAGWMQIAGQSPLTIRALSLFAGVLTVAAAYGIGRRLFSRRVGALGMLIVAASPFHVSYSQEARMYAALGLFCALTILFFIQAICGARSGLRYWVMVAIFAALAMYMQNLAAFFLLAFGLSTLPRPKVFVRVAAAGAAAFGLWLPWFVNIGGQFAKLQQAYWVTRPTLLTLVQTAMVYHVGEELLEARTLLPLALSGAIMLPLLLAFQLFILRNDANVRRAIWLAALAFGTPLLLFAVSFYQPVYIHRALLPAAVMYMIGLGWLLMVDRMPAPIRGLLAGLLAIIAVAGLWAHYTFEQFPRPNFPAALAFLRQNAKAGDVILHSNKLSFFPMHYYDRDLPQSFLADPPGSGSDTLALPTQEVLGLLAVAEVETAVQGAKRVWLVIFDKAVQEYEPDPHPHLFWLKMHYSYKTTKHFDDLTVYEFVSPIP